MAEKLLSPQEVADHLGVPLATVYGWRSNRKGPRGARIGRHIRYRESDVESWIDGQYAAVAADVG
jgi:excisionase family DNA binding protein